VKVTSQVIHHFNGLSSRISLYQRTWQFLQKNKNSYFHSVPFIRSYAHFILAFPCNTSYDSYLNPLEHTQTTGAHRSMETWHTIASVVAFSYRHRQSMQISKVIKQIFVTEKYCECRLKNGNYKLLLRLKGLNFINVRRHKLTSSSNLSPD